MSRNIDGLAEYESLLFQPPKSLQEEHSLFAQTKPKSTQYKDKWAVEFFRNCLEARELKFPLVGSGSVFKDYDVHCVQSFGSKFAVCKRPGYSRVK